MHDLGPLAALVQGLVAGVVTIVVLAVRAAIDGRSGVTFADLWTASAVGLSAGLAALVLGKLIEWRIRRIASSTGGFQHGSGRQSDEQFISRTGATDRFDRFTDRARNVLTLAQDEAQRFNHSYIGTEHLLLGLLREGNGVAARVLTNMGVELAGVRTAVELIIGRGDRPVVGEVGLTREAKRVIELSIDEARRLGHRYIGTEHLLLGLVGESEGIAAGVLESVGVGLDQARIEVLRVLEATSGSG